MKNKLVTACMLAKNCEDTMLATLKFLDDNFEDVVVVYEESSDKTVKILKEQYSHFNLQHRVLDTFAGQRNYSLSFSKTKWNLIIDADEIYSFTDFDKLVKLCESQPSLILSFPRYNLQKNLSHYKLEGFPDSQLRLLPSNIRVDNTHTYEQAMLPINTKVLPFEKCSLIHFGHLRKKEFMQLKGQDQSRYIKEGGDDSQLLKNPTWFFDRNEKWNHQVSKLPVDIQALVDSYKNLLDVYEME